MAPDPEQRYASAEEMDVALAELEEWLKIHPGGVDDKASTLEALPTDVSSPHASWRPWAAAAAAAVILAAGAWWWPRATVIPEVNRPPQTVGPGVLMLATLPKALTPAAASSTAPFHVPDAHYFLPVPDHQGVVLGAMEVTRRQFQVFADTLDAETAKRLLGPVVDLDGTGTSRSNRTWIETCLPDEPATGLSAVAADAFCRWLTDRERSAGRLSSHAFFRLPWVSEWLSVQGSRAALADPDIIDPLYDWGNKWPPPPGTGNFAGFEASNDASWPDGWGVIIRRDPFVRLAPVASFHPNTLGFYDIEGNVCEWAKEPPTVTDARRQERLGPSQLLLGYSWMGRASKWEPFDLGNDHSTTGNVSRGFRIALEFEPTTKPRFLMTLHRISDRSGSPHSENPGLTPNAYHQGNTVRVTWRVQNFGPVGNAIVRSNARVNPFPPDFKGEHTVFRCPGLEGRTALSGGVTQSVTVDPAKPVYCSFDMDTSSWSPGQIAISATIHESEEPKARLVESSTPGSSIGRISDQWWYDAFVLTDKASPSK
jgi:formylglycine-generating enzyme required for sulfatase activity